MRILFPDARFSSGPDIEQAVAGPDVEFDIRMLEKVDDITPADWAKADAIIVYNTMLITERAAELASHCRILVRAGVGFDKISLAAFGRRGIPVCNTPDYGTSEVADHAIAMMLALARGVVTYDSALRVDPLGNWRFAIAPAVRRLRGTVFGVVGLGRIGTAAALRARAFGMEVVFFDPYLPNGTDLALGFRRVSSLKDLLSQADAVSLHTPLTAETKDLINAEAVAAMKPGIILINTARGPVCDLDAICDGINSGKIAAAGLDVLPDEPPDVASPLIRAWRAAEPWIQGRLILSPHAAFYSAASFEDMRRKAMETAMLYLREGTLQNCVNEAWLGEKR